MSDTDFLIAGGGYSGVLTAKLLRDNGINATVFDSKCEGGELGVFKKLPDLREYYAEYIEEYDELTKEITIHKGTVLGDVLVMVGRVKKYHSELLICTGCFDNQPFNCNILGSRPAGIFSLQTALKLISMGFTIGKKVLVVGDDPVLEIVERLMYRRGYEILLMRGKEVFVEGRERVEKVRVDGEYFNCDTLIYFCGRSEFNPFDLNGIKLGNINAKTYDYRKVRKDTVRGIKDLII
jgi:NADPH-dependent 2,4-dienoyl-CoA reductase/sulfur reductase-like enzyme